MWRMSFPKSRKSTGVLKCVKVDCTYSTLLFVYIYIYIYIYIFILVLLKCVYNI